MNWCQTPEASEKVTPNQRFKFCCMCYLLAVVRDVCGAGGFGEVSLVLEQSFSFNLLCWNYK